MLARGLQRVAAWLQCRIEPHDSAARKLSGNHPRPRRLALQGCTCRPDSRQRAVKILAKGIVTDMRRLKFAPVAVAVAVAAMVVAPNLAQAGGVGLPPAAANLQRGRDGRAVARASPPLASPPPWTPRILAASASPLRAGSCHRPWVGNCGGAGGIGRLCILGRCPQPLCRLIQVV